MSSRLFMKFPSAFCNRLTLPSTQIRNFGRSRRRKRGEVKTTTKCPPNKSCGEPPKSRKSKWSFFGSSVAEVDEENPARETCRKLLAKQTCKPDPDLREFGGTPYRTPGQAYVIQKDVAEAHDNREPEEALLKKLERDPSIRDVEDPMPPFESVEQRMIKLCELGLHPEYRRFMHVPKTSVDLSLPKHVYKSRSGPIADDEYPPHLKVNKECLDRKNILAEFKRAVPPRQLLARMLEIKQNERPTMEAKIATGAAQKGKVDKREKEKIKA